MWEVVRYTMYDETVLGEYPSATEAYYQAQRYQWTYHVWYGFRKQH